MKNVVNTLKIKGIFMSNFKQFLVEYYNLQEQIRDQFHPENNVYRLDAIPIKGFQSRSYGHTRDWTESGSIPHKRSAVWGKGIKRTQGLFAGELRHVAPYSAMHHRGMSWLRHTSPEGHSTVVFHNDDRHAIENHTAYLSSFPKHEFKPTAAGSGEYFKKTMHETQPIHQEMVHPLHLLYQTGHTVKFVNNINEYQHTIPHDHNVDGENL